MILPTLKTLVAALPPLAEAATAFLRFYPLRQLMQLENELDEIEDEIFSVGLSVVPDGADFLRLETLQKRKRRVIEQISFIRSTIHKAD